MSVEEEVLALEATWHVAPLEGDLETVSRVTADDWIGVAPTGAVMSKGDLLEMLSSRPAPFESTVYGEIQLRVYGQTAVVTSLFRGQGQDVKLEQRFMRVYANRDGEWQCVATQVVPVPEQEEASPNVKQAVPFFSVSDIQESVRYYVDGLGFEMTQKWIDEGKLRWCWLEHGGAALMLQEFRKKGHDSWVPEGKVGEGVSICFICKDALAIYREVTSRGIPASKPFVGNGMWVTSLSDPDGYRIEFESYTDVPEGTEFSEREVGVR